jgi:predicted metal-binding membrane protein
MALESILKRDRAFILTGLVGITALAWGYIVYLAGRMSQAMPMAMDNPGMAHAPMAMPQMNMWTAVDFWLTFVMWAVMMVAMMAPSAAPMMLSYAKISRQRYPTEQGVIGPTTLFVVGYFVIWMGFSVLATLIQWLFHRLALLSPMMEISSLVLGSVLLIGAGLFQFSALKSRCLQHCRVPFTFFLREWHEGAAGALQMGAKHGLFCLGCCWSVMLLLFVAGVMNLLWVAVLAIVVLMEKVLPAGVLVSRIAGVIFILWGVWLLVAPFVQRIATYR